MHPADDQPQIHADPMVALRRELEDAAALYGTIVVGTDGSPTAQAAAGQAVVLARLFGARLHLVMAGRADSSSQLEHDAQNAPADVTHSINRHGRIEELLEAAVADLRATDVEIVGHAIADRDAADAILEVADRHDADLIVVGNRGMAGLARALGSVPNSVSHRAGRSVAIVHTTPVTAATTGRLVVGTDGSPTATLALDEATRLARALGAELHIVSAYEPLRGVRIVGAPEGAAKVWAPLPDSNVEAILSEAAAAARMRGVTVQTHAIDGDPADALVEVASRVGAGTLVVGSRGMHGARRLFGSVPNSVSHRAGCNVVIAATDL